jgi:hypothetical protein
MLIMSIRFMKKYTLIPLYRAIITFPLFFLDTNLHFLFVS